MRTIIKRTVTIAKWSDDESHRHQQLNNCSGTIDEVVKVIQSMNDTEWNHYQRQRFNIYSGLYMLLNDKRFAHDLYR